MRGAILQPARIEARLGSALIRYGQSKKASGIARKKVEGLAEINRVLKEQRKPSNTKVTLTIPKASVSIAGRLGKLCIPPMTPSRYLTFLLLEGINDAVDALDPPSPSRSDPERTISRFERQFPDLIGYPAETHTA